MDGRMDGGTLAEVAWSARWRAVRPNATYHHTFGLETAWRANASAWGYPLTDDELSLPHRDRVVQGRVFSHVGLVVWLPESGAEVLGWPS
jgi:hypothetical protein